MDSTVLGFGSYKTEESDMRKMREKQDIYHYKLVVAWVELLIIDSSSILRMAEKRARPVKLVDIQSHCEDVVGRTWKGPISISKRICCGSHELRRCIAMKSHFYEYGPKDQIYSYKKLLRRRDILHLSDTFGEREENCIS